MSIEAKINFFVTQAAICRDINQAIKTTTSGPAR